jgi:hypothetical protein
LQIRWGRHWGLTGHGELFAATINLRFNVGRTMHWTLVASVGGHGKFLHKPHDTATSRKVSVLFNSRAEWGLAKRTSLLAHELPHQAHWIRVDGMDHDGRHEDRSKPDVTG